MNQKGVAYQPPNATKKDYNVPETPKAKPSGTADSSGAFGLNFNAGAPDGGDYSKDAFTGPRKDRGLGKLIP